MRGVSVAGENSSEMDGGDGCPTMGMRLMPLDYALKIVKRTNFTYVLPQLKIIFKCRGKSAVWKMETRK